MKNIISFKNSVIVMLAMVFFVQAQEEAIAAALNVSKKGIDMQTNIGLSSDVTKKVALHLNTILSDEYVFLTKLLKYHWNITGPNFFPLHKLLDDQYKEIFEVVDEIAERVRMIGHYSFGTLQEFSKNSRIQEHPGKNPSADEMIADLVKDHEAIIMALRNVIPEIEDMADFGTMDFLTGLMEQHEKMAWFLRAHLQ